MSGSMFETYVISEIVKTYTNRGIDIRSRFSYYRDNNGKEIDLIIEDNGGLHPIEIKKSSDPGKEAMRNFSVLGSLGKTVGKGAVLCLAPFPIPLDSDNMIIPVSAI